MLAREGTTPAKLKHLKQAVVPPARNITKTDLAKFINAWNGKPDIVSLGLQKNFQKFMEGFITGEDELSPPLPDVAAFKSMIAQAILFKKTTSLVRPMFPAFQGNVVNYLISVLAESLKDKLHLEKIWNNQDLSNPLRQQLQVWAHEVHDVLQKSSEGRMISEWAKKPECWEKVRSFSYSPARMDIPETM